MTRKAKALRSFETPLNVYQSTVYNIPEDLDVNQYHYENLESYNTYVVFVFKILRVFGVRFLAGLYANIM